MPLPEITADLNNVWRRSSDDRFVVLSGPDAGEWLQGQATQDVARLQPGESAEFCVCSPTGQIVALAQVFRRGGEWCVHVPETCLSAFVQRLEDTVILEDMAWSVLDEVQFFYAAYGSSATCEVPDVRFGARGGWSNERPTGRELTPAEWDWVRFAHGVPVIGLDLVGKVLPPELGAAFEARAVSYSKGCYVGQEVLMRLHSRGHTNRTWVALELSGEASPGPALGVGGEPAGTLLRTVGGSRWGSAFVRNDFAEEGRTLTVGGVDAVVHTLPLRQVSS